jgi:DNA-3-methyladenine glycosylase I
MGRGEKRRRSAHDSELTETVKLTKSNVEIVDSSSDQKTRCSWVPLSDKLYCRYHDEEWARPCHDEKILFEMLNLEGAQAGLSWQTILRKRESYRVAFDDWDPNKISQYDTEKISELLSNPGIVRNKLKVAAVISNAQAYLQLKQSFGSLDAYIWSHVPHGTPLLNSGRERVITSPLSDSISKDLKKRGFKFVGSTTIYAYLQAIGVVNDHDETCEWKHVCQDQA